jgi:two-component system chemotaxis response regulator CheY
MTLLPDKKLSNKSRMLLLVEDDEAILTTMQNILELSGYSVETAKNGQEALQKLTQIERPCLILLDLMMPVMNGIQFLEAVQKGEVFAGIPIVIVSAFGEKVKNVSGYVKILKKPFDLDLLLKTVGHYCD